MKRYFSSLLILCLLLSVFASCTADDGSDVPTDTESAASETETETETETEEVFVPDFYIVEDGVSDYVIVHGENAAEFEIKAASELQSYIKQISGAELPIVSDTAARAEKELVVGVTNREAEGQFDRAELMGDGFVIKSEENTIWLIGGEERGTLYAAYTFLEEHLGCRFYTPTFEVIPENEDIGVLICEDKQIPVFEHRYANWYDIVAASIQGNDIQYKLKQTMTSVHAGHTLPRFSHNGVNDPCLSSEDVFNAVVADVHSQMAQNPDLTSIGYGQGDLSEMTVCSCSDCMESIAQYGYSGHYLRFINRVAEAIADDYPDLRIVTFAYWFTQEPPKGGVVCADNVSIQLCNLSMCKHHPYEEYIYGEGEFMPEGSSFLEMFEGWDAVCDYLTFYDYSTNFSCYNSMVPNFYAAPKNYRFFAENGVKGVYSLGTQYGQSTNGEFCELRSYLLCKLMWDPYMTEEEYFGYMDEFLRDFYGPGWEGIREFIDLMENSAAENRTEKGCFGSFYSPEPIFALDRTDIINAVAALEMPSFTLEQLRNFKDIDWEALYEELGCRYLFPNETVIKGYEAFFRAIEMAETEEQKAHLDKSMIQLDVVYSFHLAEQCPKAVILPMLFNRALEPYIADGSLSEDEATSLKFAFMDITDPLLPQNEADLIEFNRALAEKMIKYGINALAECVYLNDMPFEEIDFSGVPGDGPSLQVNGWVN